MGEPSLKIIQNRPGLDNRRKYVAGKQSPILTPGDIFRFYVVLFLPQPNTECPRYQERCDLSLHKF